MIARLISAGVQLWRTNPVWRLAAMAAVVSTLLLPLVGPRAPLPAEHPDAPPPIAAPLPAPSAAAPSRKAAIAPGQPLNPPAASEPAKTDDDFGKIQGEHPQ